MLGPISPPSLSLPLPVPEEEAWLASSLSLRGLLDIGRSEDWVGWLDGFFLAVARATLACVACSCGCQGVRA